MTIIEWSRPADYTLSCILDKKRNTDKEMQMGRGGGAGVQNFINNIDQSHI